VTLVKIVVTEDGDGLSVLGPDVRAVIGVHLTLREHAARRIALAARW
jgi:hypothetical protein